jgi:hypothetical protein
MTKPPPVPKDNQPRKSERDAELQKKPLGPRSPENTAEVGETGNIRQNTTNQGLRRNR